MFNGNKNYILYLNKEEVIEICKNLKTLKIIEEVFMLHGTKNTVLADEAYLSWVNKEDESARSLNMPCFIGGKYQAAGTKIINGNIANFKRGIDRASGLTLLFDNLTGQIICAMDSAYISSLRTASVTTLGIGLLKKKDWNKTIALLGLGKIGQAHLDLLSKNLKNIRRIYLFDLNENSIKNFIGKFRDLREKFIIAADPKEAIINSDIVITATTTNTGYIPFEWLRKGSLVIHVSLDDLLPDAITKADKLIVDDWNLVKNDNKRIFGKMFRDGKLPSIHAEFADIILKKKTGRENDKEIIIFNPFGLAIEDIAIAHHVYQKAARQNIGRKLKR